MSTKMCSVALDKVTLIRKFEALVDRTQIVSIMIAVFSNDGNGVQMLHVEGMAINDLIGILTKGTTND